MATFEFEVSNLIKVEVEAKTVEDARMVLVDHPSLYESELANDCCISDGEEVKDE